MGRVVRNTNYRKEVNAMSDELTVTNACYQCMIQMELCPDCSDLRDSRATEFAHEIVDDGNDIYRYAPMYTSLTKIEAPVSGHEWIGSTTIGRDGKEREEYLEAISLISDRIFELNMEMPPNSMVCQTCHYTFNKHSQCPNCN